MEAGLPCGAGRRWGRGCAEGTVHSGRREGGCWAGSQRRGLRAPGVLPQPGLWFALQLLRRLESENARLEAALEWQHREVVFWPWMVRTLGPSPLPPPPRALMRQPQAAPQPGPRPALHPGLPC